MPEIINSTIVPKSVKPKKLKSIRLVSCLQNAPSILYGKKTHYFYSTIDPEEYNYNLQGSKKVNLVARECVLFGDKKLDLIVLDDRLAFLGYWNDGVIEFSSI